DFILEFEVLCDPALNSGCQIRSHIKSVGQDAGRREEVFGYQVEIASADSGASGGVWDEARKSYWLYNARENPAAARAFKDNQWNRYRIECIGDHVRTWINGVACADFYDPEDLSGFIGLQVHSVPGDQVLQVRWRNLRIRDLGRHVWKGLFNGQNLDGWGALPGGNWTVEDGVLVGRSPASESRHGLLLSDRTFNDFTVRVQFQALKGNSGLYFRCEKVDDAVGVHGIQAEIDATKDVGGLYETGGRAWIVQPTAEQVQSWFKPNEWNTLTVSAHGRRIVVHVNNRKTAELTDDPGRLGGHLALQLHGGQDMDIRFREVATLSPQPAGRSAEVIEPFNGKTLDGWKVKGDPSKSRWGVGKARISPADPKSLEAADGSGEMINLARQHGDSLDIYSTQTFGDCHIELEVMVPQGSNSGIYVMGEYEIQVLDSYGRTEMSGGDMGAIYGAAVPKVNASRPAGEWQQYVIDFRAPRFDADGNKTANAKFLKVELNGKLLHADLEMPSQTPGGVAGREAAVGPLMFQGNHGAVAYRNIRISPMNFR
ncbi:MAG: DUF1080 domain-containing protein, partial [Sedimentisphaerales bacterium]|nr:DUF1080 domain-containing protein [Sedimentisphaerales bacterium]